VRFLVDECTGPAVARWLRKQGHEVISVYEEALGAEDDWISQQAFDEDWILVTNDKDFGEKVYRERRPHKGIVLLRVEDQRTASKIETMRRLINDYGDQLPARFAVVTETRVRFARR